MANFKSVAYVHSRYRSKYNFLLICFTLLSLSGKLAVCIFGPLTFLQNIYKNRVKFATIKNKLPQPINTGK